MNRALARALAPAPSSTPVDLPGSLRDDSALRLCGKCGAKRGQAGGVQLTVARWVCAACWKSRFMSQMDRKR